MKAVAAYVKAGELSAFLPDSINSRIIRGREDESVIVDVMFFPCLQEYFPDREKHDKLVTYICAQKHCNISDRSVYFHTLYPDGVGVCVGASPLAWLIAYALAIEAGVPKAKLDDLDDASTSSDFFEIEKIRELKHSL